MANTKGNFISQSVSYFLNKTIHGSKDPTRTYNRTSRGQFKTTQHTTHVVLVKEGDRYLAHFSL